MPYLIKTARNVRHNVDNQRGDCMRKEDIKFSERNGDIPSGNKAKGWTRVAKSEFTSICAMKNCLVQTISYK